MPSRVFLWCALFSVLATAYRLDLRQTVTCSYSVVAGNGDTCDSLASSWGISVPNFESMNPGTSCPTLVVGQQYCILGSVSIPQTTTPISANSQTPVKSSTSSKHLPIRISSETTQSTSTTSSLLHEPTQSGQVANCNKFYYVNTGDTCATIVAKYGIILAEFYSWNPAVGSQCTSMWAEYWVCVGIPGAITTQPIPTSTPTGPQPQMPGIVSTCKNYYLVKSGDSCYTIGRDQHVSLSQLLSWNTQVNSQCTNLWLGYYICIGT